MKTVCSVRDTLEQALEVLENWMEVCPQEVDNDDHIVIAALKEAIKNQGEPVAVVADDYDNMAELLRQLPAGTKLYTSAPEISLTNLPEGWQLVPEIPTKEMVAAALTQDDGFRMGSWYAMLSAAPKHDKTI
jgi:hypothetical protein